MTTNLRTIRDHPAVLIKFAVSDTRFVGMNTAVEWDEAATYLRNYETDNGVTFVALDNDGLERVREAYHRQITTQNYAGQEDERDRLQELESAVRDLLGLDDA